MIFEQGLVERVEVPVLRLSVTPMTAVDTAQWVTSRNTKSLLANHNLHSAYLYHTDPRFFEFCERADRVVIDGTPVLWLTKLRRRDLNSRHRIGSTDWITALSDVGRGGRLLVYGAAPESNARCVASLTKLLGPAGWSVEGLDGYVDERRGLEWLSQGAPTLVIVGLGMPKQEEFLLTNWEKLPNAVYANVGGAIDYLGGSTRLAPRWAGAIGIEWLWRLVHAPHRLAHRYLIEPVKLGAVLVRSRCRKRRGASVQNWDVSTLGDSTGPTE